MSDLSLYDNSALPEREYYAAPRRVRRKRRTRRSMAVLLTVTLLAGFLLGRATAQAEEPPGEDASVVPVSTVKLAEPVWAPEEDAGETPEPLVPAAETAVSPREPAALQPEATRPQAPQSQTQDPRPQAPQSQDPRLQDPAGGGQEVDWQILLVNFETPLSDGFTVPELTTLKNGHRVDSRAYPDLQAMMDAARAAGMDPIICSSYRTEEKQAELYERKVQTVMGQGYGRAEAESLAAQWVARPGTSEHQTGLALDIVSAAYQLLDEQQAETAAQQWLMAHCWEYGFILRYPTDKSGITGVGYEPWHYRYVGKEAAKAITEQGVCLEEYLAGD